jgi:hypothetical protein
MSRRRWVVVMILVAIASGCARPPSREAFVAGWKQAVQAKDGAAVWRLLDASTRARILEGVRRSQARAAKDATWKALAAWVNAPVDVAQPPEQVAVALLARRLGDSVNGDGSPPAHLEGGRWVATVEPVGFVDPTGAALTLDLLLLAPYTPPPPSAITGRRVSVPIRDFRSGDVKEPSVVEAEYRQVAQRIGEDAKLPPAWVAVTMLLFRFYSPYILDESALPLADEQRGKIVESSYGVEPDGSITVTIGIFSDRLLRVEDLPQPRLGFGAWPPAK